MGRVLRKVYLKNEVDYRVSAGSAEIRVTADPTDEDLVEGREACLNFKKVFAFTL